jgi:hypothetical protein
MKAKLLFVSTPGKCFDHRTGLYDFDLMGWLQKLCRHFAGGFVVAYDWAGSSSTDARDKPWFDQIFKAADSDGRSLFQEWTEAPMEQKEGLIDRAERLLFETHWLASYKGSIKAQMRETCQSGAKAILLRFEGGPVTRVEARAMPVLVSECLADLAQLGVCNPVVELLAFETVYEFADAALFGVLGEIYGEHWDPIPPSLLAELKEAGPASAAGSRANSGARLSVEQAEHTQDSSACESHTVGSASQIAQVPTRTFRSVSWVLRVILLAPALVGSDERERGRGRAWRVWGLGLVLHAYRPLRMYYIGRAPAWHGGFVRWFILCLSR